MHGLPFFLTFASAFASSFYEQPFPETVRNTPTIVRGKIGKSETQWATLTDGSKHLFTYYDVEVSDAFKGGARTGTSIRIRELGGSKDGVTLSVSGTAGFDRGEDVVVMLGEANAQVDSAYPVIGMMMGKFTLEKGTDGKEYLRGPGIGSASAKTAKVSLEVLRDIIRTQASEAKAALPPSPVPKAASAELFSEKPVAHPAERAEIRDEGLTVTRKRPEGGWGRAAIVFALGAAIGGGWFLKSRKKRR